MGLMEAVAGHERVAGDQPAFPAEDEVAGRVPRRRQSIDAVKDLRAVDPAIDSRRERAAEEGAHEQSTHAR